MPALRPPHREIGFTGTGPADSDIIVRRSWAAFGSTDPPPRAALLSSADDERTNGDRRGAGRRGGRPHVRRGGTPRGRDDRDRPRRIRGGRRPRGEGRRTRLRRRVADDGGFGSWAAPVPVRRVCP